MAAESRLLANLRGTRVSLAVAHTARVWPSPGRMPASIHVRAPVPCLSLRRDDATVQPRVTGSTGSSPPPAQNASPSHSNGPIRARVESSPCLLVVAKVDRRVEWLQGAESRTGEKRWEHEGERWRRTSRRRQRRAREGAKTGQQGACETAGHLTGRTCG